MRRFLGLLLCLLIGLPASSPRLTATGFDAAGDESNAENSAAELIAADPKLKSWMQTVPLATQQELSRSIALSANMSETTLSFSKLRARRVYMTENADKKISKNPEVVEKAA
ncbi:MAG: hypothetical protein F9B45_15920, partial [Phycisphaera sp. RhM]|nr:hypothetical protein [Phycisphaera sp. RhM]